MKTQPIAIQFTDVSKAYKLYRSDAKRFLGLLLPFVRPTLKLANDNLSFNICQGESVAILGRNGAGKSTVLKLITGVAFPTAGSITVNGTVSAMLELTAGFELDSTGRENIHLKGCLMGLSKKQMILLEQTIIEFAEIEEYIDQPVRTYSSGMKARLGFAINASVRPDIMIVDEALSVGDTKFQKKCRQKIKEIQKDGKVTFILVTHSMESAKDFCDRGIVLKDGELAGDAKIDKAIEIYEKI